MMYAIKSKEEIINKGLCGWYTMFEDNGKCLFGSKTTNDYSSEGYIVVDEKTFNTLLKEHETALCNDWAEITEEEYENALNVLPPVKWYNGGFFISEALTSTIHSFYQKYNGKFYVSYQDIFSSRNDIMESLRNFLMKP